MDLPSALASDYEAVGRDGGCVKFDINSAHVLRYDSALLFVCTRGKFISRDLAYTQYPLMVLVRIVEELNTEFGTQHKPCRWTSRDARPLHY